MAVGLQPQPRDSSVSTRTTTLSQGTLGSWEEAGFHLVGFIPGPGRPLPLTSPQGLHWP